MRWLQAFGGEDGAAALEFAIMAPVALAMIFFVLLGGWAMHGMATVRFALEKTSRTLLFNPGESPSDLQATVAKEVAYLGDPNVSVSLSSLPAPTGYEIIRATATYRFVLDVPMLDATNLTYSTSTDIPIPTS